MIDNIEVLRHSCIKISGDKTIYMDPFRIEEEMKDADLIFVTHNHYDHYSEDDIEKIKKDNTQIVVPEDLLTNVLRFGFEPQNVLAVEPNKKYKIDGIEFETVPAYNINKQFHPKVNEWVGYIIILDGLRYYFAGDTDITEESKKVKCDVAFVPVGGTYTMNAKEAVDLMHIIKPRVAVPIHYGCIVGTQQDADFFVKWLGPDIEGEILMK